jgi:hypothetical protein
LDLPALPSSDPPPPEAEPLAPAPLPAPPSELPVPLFLACPSPFAWPFASPAEPEPLSPACPLLLPEPLLDVLEDVEPLELPDGLLGVGAGCGLALLAAEPEP